MVLNIGCWNINGLISKLRTNSVHRSEMRSIFNTLDFIGLVEKWTTPQSNLGLPGFSYLSKHRKKTPQERQAVRGSGVVLQKHI